MNSGPYTISTIADITGINPVTLRAWERRHGLITPIRTESGHRLYTDKDIEQIRKILQLVNEGVSVGHVKEALQNMKERDAGRPKTERGSWQDHLQEMLDAVTTFNEPALERVYNEVMSLYPVDVVTRELLLPLFETLGKRWDRSKTGIAEEHFFSVYVRNKLGARFHHRNTVNDGPLLVAACLPGEQHEFGLLLFALAAHAQNYRLILLGANMPLAPLVEVVKKTRCQGVVLAGSAETDDVTLEEDLKDLCSSISVPV